MARTISQSAIRNPLDLILGWVQMCGSHSRLFAGSDKGGERIANILTIIETVKLQGHNPEAYLTDVLTRIQNHPKDRIDDLRPRNWVPANARCEAA